MSLLYFTSAFYFSHFWLRRRAHYCRRRQHTSQARYTCHLRVPRTSHCTRRMLPTTRASTTITPTRPIRSPKPIGFTFSQNRTCRRRTRRTSPTTSTRTARRPNQSASLPLSLSPVPPAVHPNLTAILVRTGWVAAGMVLKGLRCRRRTLGV
jgi:hypothetical protein